MRDLKPQIQQLARRMNERRQEHWRRTGGRRVPITPAMSRILEHDPSYEPYRPRSAKRDARRPYVNPGIFTVQAIATSLGTTVGDLLGEPGPRSPRDVLNPDERQALRRLLSAVWRLFDLGDPALAAKASEPRSALQ